jgi:hypothetical protein
MKDIDGKIENTDLIEKISEPVKPRQGMEYSTDCM